MTGFDVHYGLTTPTIEQHCCRRHSGCDGGLSLRDACEIISQWYDEQAKMWRNQTHPDCQYFI